MISDILHERSLLIMVPEARAECRARISRLLTRPKGESKQISIEEDKRSFSVNLQASETRKVQASRGGGW